MKLNLIVSLFLLLIMGGVLMTEAKTLKENEWDKVF